MANQSHFEINVSQLTVGGVFMRQPRHLFATAERSVVTHDDLERVLPHILQAFPEPDYRVEVTRWSVTGTPEVWRLAGLKAYPEQGVQRPPGGRPGTHCPGVRPPTRRSPGPGRGRGR